MSYLSTVPQTEIVNSGHTETKPKESPDAKKKSIYMEDISVGARKLLDGIDKYKKFIKIKSCKIKIFYLKQNFVYPLFYFFLHYL